MPPKAVGIVPVPIVGLLGGDRGVLIRNHTDANGTLRFEIRRGRILRFQCQGIVIVTDSYRTINREAPKRTERYFRRRGGGPLAAVIAATPGGMMFCRAKACNSGKLPSCQRLICVYTPAVPNPPLPQNPVFEDLLLKASYLCCLQQAYRAGCTSIAIPIMGPDKLRYGYQRAADIAIEATMRYFYSNPIYSAQRRAHFRTVVFFIEDEPTYSPVRRENAAIRAFEAHPRLLGLAAPAPAPNLRRHRSGKTY